MAAAAFGDLEALEQLLTGGGAEIDTNAEPDYSTSVAFQREVIPPGSPVSSQPCMPQRRGCYHSDATARPSGSPVESSAALCCQHCTARSSLPPSSASSRGRSSGCSLLVPTRCGHRCRVALARPRFRWPPPLCRTTPRYSRRFTPQASRWTAQLLRLRKVGVWCT